MPVDMCVVGQKPTNSYTFNVTATEVVEMGEIREIIGNTTSTPNPRPDWDQTDPTKADYIKNKPAALTEDGLQDAVNNALAQAKENGELDELIPVKGTDYFTDEDKAEMVAAVIAALPSAEGVEF